MLVKMDYLRLGDGGMRRKRDLGYKRPDGQNPRSVWTPARSGDSINLV